MILSKTIFVKLVASNIKHYESLGYFIPRYFNKSNYEMLVKIGTSIEVKVSDLPNGSGIKVLCQCDNPNCNNGNPVKKWIVYYQIKKSSGKYLCTKCANQDINKREKLRNSHLGKKHSLKTRQLMSEHSWSKTHKGKNSPFYDLNKSFDERVKGRCIPEIYIWRKKVNNKYAYTCQICKYVGKKNDGIIKAHHLNSYSKYPDQRTNINNGICLCKNCHKLLHKMYGQITTRNDYIKFKKWYKNNKSHFH